MAAPVRTPLAIVLLALIAPALRAQEREPVEFVLDAMARHPILIERPILVRGARAVVGRPPENVLQLL